MKKSLKMVFAVASLVTVLSAAGLGYSLTMLFFNMPMTGVVVNTPSLQVFVGGSNWVNNTSIDWGNLNFTNTKNVDIYNSGNVNVTVRFFSNTPTNWTLTYSRNNTLIPVDLWVNGTFTLNIPAGTQETNYVWVNYLEAI